MSWFEKHPIRKDSISIALLAVFSAMAIILPLVEIPIDPEGRFTLDPAGIPLIIVFLGLGIVYSLFSIVLMWAGITLLGEPQGAIFKFFAEFYTVIGLVIVKVVATHFNLNKKIKIGLYLVLGCTLRAAAMYPTNIVLLQILWGLSPEAAAASSALYVGLNMLQAAVNIVGGVILFYLIPENLALQAGLGDDVDRASEKVQELPPDEIPDSSTDEDTSDRSFENKEEDSDIFQ